MIHSHKSNENDEAYESVIYISDFSTTIMVGLQFNFLWIFSLKKCLFLFNDNAKKFRQNWTSK